MKNILYLTFLIAGSLTFAQTDLYVRNNSYVYVDGTGFTSGPNSASLYVTNRINLNGTNSHIYLRNEAQLLQGNNIGNSGAGRLSAFQTGTANTYAYNYWSSPVGINTGAAGNTTFQPVNNMYRETAAPITSTPFGYVAGYNGTTTQIASYWLYTFIGLPTTTNAYEDWVGLGGGSLPIGGDPNGTLASGYGFTMKGNPSGAQQYDFRGRPNNGNITVTLNANRETLVGNPYPSALDARDFIHNPTNATRMTGTLKYWEQAPGATSHNLSDYVGGYGIYTISAGGVDSFTNAPFTTYLLDGTPTNAPFGSGTKVARRYIPIGQGFMIEGNATGGTIVFNNAQREFYKQSGTDSYFFRNQLDENEQTTDETIYNEDGFNIVPADFKRFRINVDFTENELYTRQLLMNFHNSATDGFDYGLEGKGDIPLASDAYWILDNQPYVIQAFNYDQTLRIPLIVKARANQPVRFRIYDIQNFDESQPIYIHDIENQIYVNLRESNYDINLAAGLYSERFEITFSAQTLGTTDVTMSDFAIFQNNETSEINLLNPNLQNLKTVTIYDVSGKQIINTKNLPLSEKYYFSSKTFSDGLYVVSVAFKSGETLNKKVMVANKK
ncbi:Por secretion system C-terminal sorting domain-containing protein [Bizionia echini]|uniref:Por secretion system C-terminal sorting domain-containing protein n=1 Tax=Bizionia echini TaxID=649333 RepID=A0A1I5C522_9FLAO|nr:T9SS type A sorting domain-containing protein [Bizionia echini]SFN82095.1 Por secretion system C-terminal sorting domain-containing protein [Bizionia echini]